MRGKNVGLYVGINSVGVAVVQAKRITSIVNFELSSLDESKAETLSNDVRWEALINKALREAGADTDEVYVALSDKDFIFRSLEMPLMKKTEIESSLIYEIEKYIPFKLEELEWDYEYIRVPGEKKANVSFIGIRESNFNRIRDILSRLTITARAIEPACLSLARMVKSLKEFSKINDFALLDFTKVESYLTFFQNNLPVFNRHLTVPKKEEALDLDKFIESINLSLQYFKREFKNYKLDKLIVVGEAQGDLMSSLHEGLQIEAEIEAVSPYNLTENNNNSVEGAKALGVANRDYYPGTFRPVLKKTEITPEGVAALPVAAPVLRIGLLSILLGLGLAGTIAFYIVKENEIITKKNELRLFERSIMIPKELKDLSWKERADMTKTKADEVKALKEITASFRRLFGFFNTLGKGEILPEGLWLERLNVTRRKDGYSGDLRGYVFRDDDYKERLGLDEFISALKAEESVKANFSSVELNSSKRTKIRGFEVTDFSIKLR